MDTRDENLGETFDLADHLQNLRLMRGWTVVELAARSGVTRRRLMIIEAGGERRADDIAALARALGVSLDSLFPANFAAK